MDSHVAPCFYFIQDKTCIYAFFALLRSCTSSLWIRHQAIESEICMQAAQALYHPWPCLPFGCNNKPGRLARFWLFQKEIKTRWGALVSALRALCALSPSLELRKLPSPGDKLTHASGKTRLLSCSFPSACILHILLQSLLLLIVKEAPWNPALPAKVSHRAWQDFS